MQARSDMVLLYSRRNLSLKKLLSGGSGEREKERDRDRK